METSLSTAPTKSQMVADRIEAEIRAGTLLPGARMYGMRELASRFRVSFTAVNHAYNILEDKRMIVRKSRSGTFVNPAMKFKGAKLVAVLTSYHKQDIEGYFEPMFGAANSANAFPMVCTLEAGNCWREMVKNITAREPDLLLIDVEAKDFPMEELRRLLGSTPHCFVNRWEWAEANPEHAVMIDYVSAYAQAFRMLFEKGHKRILFAGNHRAAAPFVTERLSKAAHRAGLEFPSAEIEYIGLKDQAGVLTDVKSPEVHRIFGGLRSRPTAIFASSDYVGFNMRQMLGKFNPQLAGLETIGFFDTKWSKQPGREFSTFAIDYADMWWKAFSVLKDEGNGGGNLQWTLPKFIRR